MMKTICYSNRIYLVLCIITMFLGGCDRKKSTLSQEILRLQSQKVNIPFDSMLRFNALSSDASENSLKNYKIVIYTDSVSCSSCSIKRLFNWEPLIDSLQESLSFIFIFSPQKEDIERVKQTLLTERLSWPVYIDTCSAFDRRNPHIPDNSLMHTFLLNENDSVVLVGNPQSNPRIKELLFNILYNVKQ